MYYGDVHIFKYMNKITLRVYRHRDMTNTKIYFENKPGLLEGIEYPILSYRNILTYFTQPCQMVKKEKEVFDLHPGLPHLKSMIRIIYLYITVDFIN